MTTNFFLMKFAVMMKFAHLIIITLIYLTAVEVGALQKFAEVPTYTEADPDEDALLKCRVSDKRGICSWQKDNKPLGMYRGKYEWATARSTMTGDCSLLIRAVKLEIDDGMWQCQVTASNYDMQDALSSRPAVLAVRVAPQSMKIIFNGSRVLTDQKIKLSAGSSAFVICEVRYSNPSARIEWYLESGRLISWSQTNASEVNRPKLWAARSILELSATRSTHGRQLVCRAHHPSYPAPYYRNAYAVLDVSFIPVVSIVGIDVNRIANLEEGLSSLSLNCTAEGNPKPKAWWTKNGQEVIFNGSKLIIASVTRNHSGIYNCQAKNTLGTSDSVKVEIDVKYAPRVIWVKPNLIVDADLHSQVTLECKANGNPSPSYHWYHCPQHDFKMPATTNLCVDGYIISSTSRLQLFNVTYYQRGRYFCVAKNFIGHMKRTHRSEPIRLNVFGPPAGSPSVIAHGWRCSEANIQITICADPPPKIAYWERGTIRLDAPSEIDRYKALERDIVEDCYLYTLSIKEVQKTDAGLYTLRVGNEKGYSYHKILFIVHDTAYVAPMIAAVFILASITVLLLLVVMNCRNKREMEMKNKGHQFVRHQRQAYYIEVLSGNTEWNVGYNSKMDSPS